MKRLPRSNFDFIWLSFLNVSRFHPSIRFGDCDVCYLFYGENLASPYKCSKVELICSACVKRKTLCPSNGYHMDATGLPETNIYSSGGHVTVGSVRPTYPPQKFDIS